MKSLCVLAAAIVQGVVGQQEIFEVQPKTQNVVPKDEKVVLECLTRDNVTCAWTLKVPGLQYTSFLNTQTEFLESSGIRVRDPQPNTNDCTIIIDQVKMKHNGNYTCSPYVKRGGQVDSTPATVIVAVKPASVAFVGDLANATELTVNTTEAASVTCEARDARPKAALHWFLGERNLIEGVFTDEETDPGSELVTSRSTLTHQFERQDGGVTLRCHADHPAYAGENDTEATLDVVVQFVPVRAGGSDLGTLYGFSEGEDKDVTVHFTSNPAPTEILWTVGPDVMLAAGNQTEDGHIIASLLEEVNAEEHQYAVRLTFSPVRSEDQNTTFLLQLGNALGQQELRLRVGVDAPPPPPPSAAPPPPPPAAPTPASEGGVSGAAIGGIVAVIVLLAVMSLVAFARSRGKWSFAAKLSDAGADAQKTRKKEESVESPVSKDETKELTGPDGESSPEGEQMEVVITGPVPDEDGVKIEVPSSPEEPSTPSSAPPKHPRLKSVPIHSTGKSCSEKETSL